MLLDRLWWGLEDANIVIAFLVVEDASDRDAYFRWPAVLRCMHRTLAALLLTTVPVSTT